MSIYKTVINTGDGADSALALTVNVVARNEEGADYAKDIAAHSQKPVSTKHSVDPRRFGQLVNSVARATQKHAVSLPAGATPLQKFAALATAVKTLQNVHANPLRPTPPSTSAITDLSSRVKRCDREISQLQAAEFSAAGQLTNSDTHGGSSIIAQPATSSTPAKLSLVTYGLGNTIESSLDMSVDGVTLSPTILYHDTTGQPVDLLAQIADLESRLSTEELKTAISEGIDAAIQAQVAALEAYNALQVGLQTLSDFVC